MSTTLSLYSNSYAVPNTRHERGWTSLTSWFSAVNGHIENAITDSKIYNVKASTYGALGDNSTDDTTAIQAAITAAGSNGTVYIPRGNYVISSTLTLTSSGVNIVGEGYNSVLKAATNFSGSMLKIYGSPVYFPFVSGLRFAGSSQSGVTAGLELDGVYYGQFSHLYGDGLTNGAFVLADPATYGVYENSFDHLYANALKGISLLGSGSYAVVRNQFTGGVLVGRGTGVSGGIGVELGDGSHANSSENIINLAVRAFENGFTCYGDRNTIDGVMTSNGAGGTIDSGADYTIVRGVITNTITDNGTNTKNVGYTGT